MKIFGFNLFIFQKFDAILPSVDNLLTIKDTLVYVLCSQSDLTPVNAANFVTISCSLWFIVPNAGISNVWSVSFYVSNGFCVLYIAWQLLMSDKRPFIEVHYRLPGDYVISRSCGYLKFSYVACWWSGDAIVGPSTGPRLNIKTVLSRYGDSYVKDKTAVRTSYL